MASHFTQNGNGHKCLPVIDRADKVIYGSSEALAYAAHDVITMDKLHSLLVYCKICYYYFASPHCIY